MLKVINKVEKPSLKQHSTAVINKLKALLCSVVVTISNINVQRAYARRNKNKMRLFLCLLIFQLFFCFF